VNPDKDDKLVGFLCIDSPSSNVFMKRYDVDTMRAIAAAMHPMMIKWTELVLNSEGKRRVS